MSDFVCMDWDLQAIVRGSSSEVSASVMDSLTSCFPPSSVQQDVSFEFPDICESTTILDELEELYKPFYPQTILTSTSISVPTEVKKPKKMREPQPISGSANDTGNTDQAAPPKRGRKNQQKRVVQQVTADGLSCDMWAWRKYGQKPIKGSPYPRSYYRCSSSKGCSARKQVERSRTDPGQFVITYSADHNHTHPTRRSSLAGSTRNKPLKRSALPSTNEPTDQQTVLSPITPFSTSTEDEFVHQENIKKEEEGNGFEDGEAMPDFSDELFSNLQDLEDFLFDQFTDNISDKPWFIDDLSATISAQGL